MKITKDQLVSLIESYNTGYSYDEICDILDEKGAAFFNPYIDPLGSDEYEIPEQYVK